MANVIQIHKVGNNMHVLFDDGTRLVAAPTGRSKWISGAFASTGGGGEDPGPGSGLYVPPFGMEPGADVTPDIGEYGPRDISTGAGSFHEGIDFGYGPANIEGTPIHAIGNGTVETINGPGDYGNNIVINHGIVTWGGQERELRSLYAHMYQTSPLSVGASVTSESVVGGIGHTSSKVIADHLHLEIHMCEVGGGMIHNLADDGGFRTAINPRDFFEVYGA